MHQCLYRRGDSLFLSYLFDSIRLPMQLVGAVIHLCMAFTRNGRRARHISCSLCALSAGCRSFRRRMVPSLAQTAAGVGSLSSALCQRRKTFTSAGSIYLLSARMGAISNACCRGRLLVGTFGTTIKRALNESAPHTIWKPCATGITPTGPREFTEKVMTM